MKMEMQQFKDSRRMSGFHYDIIENTCVKGAEGTRGINALSPANSAVTVT